MDKPCHNITDRGIKAMIPGCIGTAARGIDYCTCKHHEKDRFQLLEEKVARLEKLLKKYIKTL